MKHKTRWFVNRVKASTWIKRPFAPDLEIDRTEYFTLEDARKKIQNEISKLCVTKNIEKINWSENSVDISYNYLDDGTKMEEVVSFKIEQFDKDKFRLVSIGCKNVNN